MRYTVIMFFTIFIFGCGNNNEISLAEVCKSSGELCEKITLDSFCKSSRREVITKSYLVREEKIESKKNKLKYELLLNLEDFVKCSEKTTFIKYDYNKFKRQDQEINRESKVMEKEKNVRKKIKKELLEREKKREQNYIFANYMLNSLNERTKGNENPYLLYWHWSRNGNNEAAKKLESLYEKNELKSYKIIFYMSQYYSKFDKEKSVDLFLKALEKLPPSEYKDKKSHKIYGGLTKDFSIHLSIFRSLVTYYYNKKDYEKAYIFSKLLELKNDKTSNILKIVKYFENQKEAEYKVDLINKALEEGRFKKTML